MGEDLAAKVVAPKFPRTRLGLSLLGAVAAITTVVAFVLQLRPEVPELSLVIDSAVRLTADQPADGVETLVRVGGTEIPEAWLLNVRLLNSGGLTLLGIGPTANVLDPAIEFELAEPWRLLRIEVVEVSEPQTIFASDTSAFSVEFRQWRQGEEVSLSILVGASATQTDPPVIQVTGRPLVDGEVVIRAAPGVETEILTSLPEGARLAGRIIGVSAAAMLFMAIISVLTWVGLVIPVSQGWWIIRYRKRLTEYIRSTPSLNMEMGLEPITMEQLWDVSASTFEEAGVPEVPFEDIGFETPVGLLGFWLICLFLLAGLTFGVVALTQG